MCLWTSFKNTSKKIFILQKRALRFMSFMSYRAHTIPAFVSSKIIPLNMLYFKSVMILMHGVFNNNAPKNILLLLTSVSNIHDHNTRSLPAIIFMSITRD
jgi:hypothetical protein